MILQPYQNNLIFLHLRWEKIFRQFLAFEIFQNIIFRKSFVKSAIEVSSDFRHILLAQGPLKCRYLMILVHHHWLILGWIESSYITWMNLSTGGVVIRSCTKPALDLIITRLRVILKILWPYKDPFAALKKWPLDLINTHLRSSKKKEWPYNRTNAEEDLLQKPLFSDQKNLKPFFGPKKRVTL